MASGMISTAVNMAVLAIGYPIYLHFLGREQYGLWLTLSVVVTVTQLGNLGMGPAVTKLVAEDYGRGDINGIARYIATAVLLVCLSGSCALAVVLLCKNNIVRAFRLSPTDARTIVSLMPYAGVLSVYVLIVQVLNSALSGLGRLDLANYIQTASRIVGIAAAVLLLSRGLGLVGLLIGSVLSHVVIHTLSWIWVSVLDRGSGQNSQ
jgi:Na+-driven multidrug efflux pump